MEMSVPLFKSSKAYPFLARGDKDDANGISALCVGVIMLPLATATAGLFVGVILLHTISRSL